MNQRDEKRRWQPGYTDQRASRSKYHNVPVVQDGRRFDSIAEGRRWAELEILQRAGQIDGLTFHPTYILQPAFTDSSGKRWRAVIYEADASYVELPEGRQVVEDVKGKSNDTFPIKVRLFRYQFPDLELRIVPADDYSSNRRR